MWSNETGDPDTIEKIKASIRNDTARSDHNVTHTVSVDWSKEKSTEVDTVTEANKVKNSQGLYEVEVTFGGEADLHKHYTRCEKNPKHEGFIPVDQFSRAHLPECYRDSGLMYATVKALASITVLIKGRTISKNRPDKDKDGNPYHLSNCRGEDISTRGTGKLTHTRIQTEEMDETCPCAECRETSSPLKKWGFLSVFTAKHLIFDDVEAAAATFEMNYEYLGEPVTKSIRGVYLEDSGIDTDWCRVVCPLHDIDFIRFVDKELIVTYEDLHKEVIKRYYKTRNDENMAVVVSHPHGCGKQISVGRWVERKVLFQALVQTATQYTYSASTCPGSSGAPVYIIKPWFSNHCHWGSLDGTNQTNYSGVHFD